MSPFEGTRALETEEARAVREHLQQALLWLARGDVGAARAAARRAADATPPDVLRVDGDGRGYAFGGRRVSLARRGSLRRILLALAEQAAARPGEALSRDEVLAAGWPGERMRAASGALRVYTAIRRLRASGLGDAILTRDDGYLLDPGVRVRVVD